MNDALKFPTNYQGARLPINYKAAKQALMECDRVDECKVWADKAEALATYARVSNDLEMEIIAKRVRLRAIAKAGELLLRIPNTSRGLHLKANQGSQPNPNSRRGVGKAAGMRPQDVNQALAIARVPTEVRELLIESPTPPAPSRLQGHPSRIRPRPVRLNRFTPGPEYREVFIHGGGITSFASFLKRHAPDKYFPFLSPDETERAARYLESIHAWITWAQRLLPATS